MKRLRKVGVLMIDRDCVVPVSLIREWVRIVVVPTCKTLGVTVELVVTCPSARKGYHVYIYLAQSVPALLAWRIQYHLGDDAKRVSLNRARMKAGFGEWNKLFEGIRPRFSTIYKAPKRLTQLTNTQNSSQHTTKQQSTSEKHRENSIRTVK